MSYLLIDLDKSVMKLADISPEAGAVLLFTQRKRKVAKKFAKSHRATKVVKCGKKDKVAAVMIAKLKKLLKADKTAGVLIISSRKKVARAINRLLDKYPDAELVLIDKVDKNQEDEVFVAEDTKYLDKPPAVPLLSAPVADLPKTEVQDSQRNVSAQADTQPDMDKLLNDALLLIQKNRPKKKAALLQELMHALRIPIDCAENVLTLLKKHQHIQIDVTENVKYSAS